MLDGRIGGTAPYGWLGQHTTLEQHLGNTVKHRLGGSGLDAQAMADLATYLRALPGPNVSRGLPSAIVAAGRALFHRSDVGCGDCHEEDGGVDGVQYAVAGRVPTDTPSLRFVAGTAPFFHDGKFASLDDLLVHTPGVMGQSVALDPDDRAALVAFLETL
jgi:cytochrome c peroxidase